MKTPNFMIIDMEVLDLEGHSTGKAGLLKAKVGEMIAIRYSKEHWRYHYYKVVENKFNKLTLEKYDY
jgi:hypothetical protein